MSLLEDAQLAFSGRYKLESEIGEGGSAHVYAAQDLKHDRRVAIKILKPGVAQSIASDRFLREIRMSAGLNHPRIVPLFDSGEVAGLPYFVMPLVDGSTLRERLQRDGTIPVADALRIATQIADALAYLHERGFVHRDVKPENILLQGDHVWLADFGIVRALQDAVTGNHTVDGMAIGTPAYMSPEQRLASPTLGGQSDQFSLAVVVYEMLVGRLPKLVAAPFDFNTPSGARFTPMHALRADVPEVLDSVLARALQVHESARWPSMHAFAEKLAESTIPTPQATPAEARPRPGLWYITMAAVAGLTLLLIARMSDNRILDPNKVAVLPLAHDGDSPGAILNGEDCSRLLLDALRHWTGIHPVDDMQMLDLKKRMGRPQSVDDVMHMATRLGAGMAVWGVVKPALGGRDKSAREVQVFLYRVPGKRPSQQARVTIDSTDDQLQVFQLITDSLLSGEVGRRRGMPVNGSRDAGAVRAYLDGHQALDSFNLVSAAKAFRRAAEVDRGYGLAYLWLAWSTQWLGADAREWGDAAERALAAGRGLTTSDSVHAQALVFMRDKRQPEACTLYRTLIAADTTDFAAWYGLGECLSSDATVVTSATSKSRWAFRTSIHEAAGAYEKAIKIAPSFTDAMGQRALERITRWLYAEVGRYRPGMSADSQRFAAWPSLSGDTLAFIPFPERAVFSESAGTRESSYRQALQRNRDKVLEVVGAWISGDSSNVLALEMLALAREANDELTTLRRNQAGAVTGLVALRRARARASGENAVRLAATQVRFLIKIDSLREAKSLADSLLRNAGMDSATAATATLMQSLAMLTGRGNSALEWGRRASAFQYSDPLRPDLSISPALSGAASDAATFASLGIAPDSVRSALERFERALVGNAGPSVEALRQQYVEQPLLFAWPALGPSAVRTRASAGNAWLPLQLAFARGDFTVTRAGLVGIDSTVNLFGVDENAFEMVVLGSRMWLALGDTTNAVRWTANAVEHVRTSGDQLIRRPTATAAYVRLLIQRSALADLRGDTLAARLWGTRAWVLWKDADPMIVEVMRPIVRWRDIPLPGGSR